MDDRPRSAVWTYAALVAGFAGLTVSATFAFDARTTGTAPLPDATSRAQPAPDAPPKPTDIARDALVNGVAPGDTASTDPTGLCVAMQRDDPEWETICRRRSLGRSLSGRVVDASGAPARGVELRFWSPDESYSQTTGEDGSFRDVRRDDTVTYDVDLLLSPGMPSVAGRRRAHLGTIGPEDTDVVLRLPFAPRAIAAGALFDGNAPARDWTVTAVSGGSEIASATTDAAGRFRLTSWNPAAFILRAQRGWNPVTLVRNGTDPASGDARYDLHHAIAGSVYAEPGVDLRGAVVTLYREGLVARTVVIGDSASFAFGPLDAAAQYEVQVALPGCIAEPHGPAVIDLNDLRLGLAKPANVLKGAAIRADGAPLQSAWIRFSSPGCPVLHVMTNLDGRFETYGASPVAYDASFLVPGPDGRLVPGAVVARCRGSLKDITLRAPR
jgi:hypothetical protein